MASTQSGCQEVAAKEAPETRFWRSLIAVFKENREVLPSLPEMIESLTAAEEHIPKLMEAQKLEGYRKKTEKELMAKQLEEATNQLKLLENEKKTEKELMAKQLEEATNQLKLLENENGTLKTELQNKEKEISESKEKLSSNELEMQTTFDKYFNDLEQHKSRNDSLKQEIEAQDDKVKQYSQSLLKAKDDLQAAHKKMEGYKSRLASLSEKRVKQDQRLVEDTLGSNRQSELEKDFAAFFDDDRMDACEKMQSIYLNRGDNYLNIYYPRLACIILETAYEQAKDVKETACDLFKELTKNMLRDAAYMGTAFSHNRKLHNEGKYIHESCTVPITVALWGEESEYSRDVVDAMSHSLKEAAHVCNLDSLVDNVSLKAFMKWSKWCEEDKYCMFSPSWQLIGSLDKYIKSCIRLTWRMVTQVPPMKLEYQCSNFSEGFHRNVSKVRGRTRSSAQQDQEEEIVFYLWPGLQDGGGRRIRPAEVLCKVKDKTV